MDVQPLVLQGRVVRLEPLALAHVPGLAQAGSDPAIWTYTVYGNVVDEGAMRAWVEKILEHQALGTDLPFAVIHLPSQAIVGATRYMEMRPEHRGLEIGGTWYAPAVQRTAVNTECKYLLLRHAFEQWGCLRVQFKTDERNVRSQRAIERLGAHREGVLRKHVILPGGFVRNSVYYSITDDEWPVVKVRLEQYLLGA